MAFDSYGTDALVDKKYNKDWNYYSQAEVNQYALIKEFERRSGDIRRLQKAKNHIINGNLEMALFYLDKVKENRTQLKMIKRRYQAIIAFIKGEFENSLSYISSNRFNAPRIYPQICLLRVANLLALSKKREFDKEIRSCQALTFDFASSDQFWLTNLKRIKLEDPELIGGNKISGLRNILGDVNYTKVWMKLAIYLNREDVILKNVSALPASAYRSKKIRELVGLAFYRKGEYKKALEFIEDIESPNADNIRGNIKLNEKKLELAFGHFNLALRKKYNSQNALERAIPLSWILGQWKEGINLLHRLVDNRLDSMKKLALETAFKIKLGDFINAEKNINFMKTRFRKKAPLEIEQMRSYVGLRRYKNSEVEDSSAYACSNYDGLNCYLNMQLLFWENLGMTMEREESTFSLKEVEISELKSPGPATPLKESITIDQKDIEELDSSLVVIDPNEV